MNATTKTEGPWMVRQGDILLERIDGKLPALGAQVPREGGRIVLAHGTATGHEHAIAAEQAAMFHLGEDTSGDVWRSAQRILQIGDDGAELVHDEHATIALPPGNYRVVRQREYSPEELRVVAD